MFKNTFFLLNLHTEWSLIVVSPDIMAELSSGKNLGFSNELELDDLELRHSHFVIVVVALINDSHECETIRAFFKWKNSPLATPNYDYSLGEFDWKLHGLTDRCHSAISF